MASSVAQMNRIEQAVPAEVLSAAVVEHGVPGKHAPYPFPVASVERRVPRVHGPFY